jgi:hypothetical protein
MIALRQCVTDDDYEVWLGVRRAVLEEREILWAAQNGVRTLVTYTQTGNENMQEVNARLGYVTTAVTIAFRQSRPL